MGKVMTDRVARYAQWTRDTLASPSEFLQMLDQSGDLDEVCRNLDLPRSRVVAFLAEHADLDAMANRALARHADRLVAEGVEIAAGEPVAVVDHEGKLVRDENGEPVLVEQSVQRDNLRVKANFQAAAFYKRSRYGEKLDVTVAVVDIRGALAEARARIAERPVIVGVATAVEDDDCGI